MSGPFSFVLQVLRFDKHEGHQAGNCLEAPSTISLRRVDGEFYPRRFLTYEDLHLRVNTISLSHRFHWDVSWPL
jgi:hypothetical protein